MFNATVITKYATTTPLPTYIDPDVNLALNGVAKSILQETSNGILIIDGTAEVSQIVTSGNIGFVLDGKYFTIDTPNQEYYVWFQVAGSGNDPLVPGRIGIPVNLTSGTTPPSDVAQILATTLSSYTPLGGPVNEFNAFSPITSLTGPIILPTTPINVGSTAGFPATGTIYIGTGASPTVVTYTGTTSTSFTGCTGGVGAFSNGDPVANNIVTITNGTQGDIPNPITDGAGAGATGFGFTVLAVGSGTISVGDRILVKDEPSGKQQYNGVYLVQQTGSASTPWLIERDFSVIFLKQGDTVFTSSGSTQAGILTILDNNITMPGQAGSPANFTVIMGTGQVSFDSIAPTANPDVCGGLIVRTDSTGQASTGDSWSVLNPGSPGQFLQVAINPTTSPANQQCLVWTPVNAQTILGPPFGPLQTNGDMLYVKNNIIQTLSRGLINGMVLSIDTILFAASGGVGWKTIDFKTIAPTAANCGDIMVYDGTAWQVLPNTGINNNVLTIDTSASLCVTWKAFSASAVGTIGSVQYTDGAGNFVAKPGFEFGILTPDSLTIPNTGRYGIAGAPSRTLLYAPSAGTTTANVAVGGGVSSLLTGDNNLIFGAASYGNAAAANDNIIIGNAAALNVQNGNDVVLIGHSSMSAATNPSNMIGIGRHVFDNYSTSALSSGNIAIGNSSQEAHLGGQGNVSIGYATLQSMAATVGSPGNNTAVGHNSLNRLAIGQYNSAFGWESLINNTNGNRSCAFGWSALAGAAAGQSITDMCAFGYQTLTAVDGTGFNNNAFGNFALSKNVSGNYNNAFGFNSLLNNTTGNANSAFGHQSLYTNTSNNNSSFGFNAMFSNNSGSDNCAFGSVALTSNDSGSRNNAFGSQSCQSITTGSSNDAFGYQSLQGLSTGSNNCAFGDNVLSLAVSTSDNSAFGYNAMANAGSGSRSCAFGSGALLHGFSNNCAFGYQSLGSGSLSVSNMSAFGYQSLTQNTTGINNNAFGYTALTTNTIGSENCAFGSNALNNNTVGDNNCGFGNNTLTNINSGNANTAVGYSALSSITTTGANTAVGYAAGQNSSGVSANQNTLIGYQAGLIVTGSQNTVVGSASGTTITTGTGNIVIGSNSADTKLATGNNNVIVGFNIDTDTAARSGCIILGNSAQVGKDNTIGLPSTIVTNTGASLSNGAATAPPTKPATYLEVNIGGTVYSIPLYT